MILVSFQYYFCVYVFGEQNSASGISVGIQSNPVNRAPDVGTTETVKPGLHYARIKKNT